jgi:hypothetical protein
LWCEGDKLGEMTTKWRRLPQEASQPLAARLWRYLSL